MLQFDLVEPSTPNCQRFTWQLNIGLEAFSK